MLISFVHADMLVCLLSVLIACYDVSDDILTEDRQQGPLTLHFTLGRCWRAGLTSVVRPSEPVELDRELVLLHGMPVSLSPCSQQACAPGIRLSHLLSDLSSKTGQGYHMPRSQGRLLYFAEARSQLHSTLHEREKASPQGKQQRSTPQPLRPPPIPSTLQRPDLF